MDIRKVKKLIELLEESGLSEIEITEGEDKVRISRQSTSSVNEVQVIPTQPVNTIDNEVVAENHRNNNFHKIQAPMIGTFYQSSEPEAKAFVKVGDPISKGDILCIIEAMKMMNQIECDVDGTIERILVQNGDPVEYDEVLFLISQN
ncbi:MAG: acetyl-CoA carboxylase biotin carboxyl carrier protein [Gammaproteobacteria bacterium]|nr:acetyl-CoA carboxylase biotin carboxyl carrier protein [Gammaproteobacteria bacterium]